MEKYLQDVEQHQALEVNYFDDNTTGQNDKSRPEDAEQMIQFSNDNCHDLEKFQGTKFLFPLTKFINYF